MKRWIAYEAHKDEYTFEQQSGDVFAFLLDVFFKGLKPVFLRSRPQKGFDELLKKVDVTYDPVDDIYKLNISKSGKNGKS
jgi:hypothetical protein